MSAGNYARGARDAAAPGTVAPGARAVAAAAWLPAAAVALLCSGMALVIGGVVVAGLFMPGVYVLVLGFLAAVGAGVLAAWPRPAR